MKEMRHWFAGAAVLLGTTPVLAQPGFPDIPSLPPVPTTTALVAEQSPTSPPASLPPVPTMPPTGVPVQVTPSSGMPPTGIPMTATPPTHLAPVNPTNIGGGTVVGSAGTPPMPIPSSTVPNPITKLPGALPAGQGTPHSTVWNMPDANCCGPTGIEGPVGQEIYMRTGLSLPFGESVLAKALNPGINITGGGRSLFFDPTGTAAWVVDGHVSWTYNTSSSEQVAWYNDESVTVRSMTRWGVGLGLGRDWFTSAPGFVGGSWDSTFRYGFDAGMRWGTGHVDLNPTSEINGYRRHQDVFAQTFVGLNADLSVPMGGWTFIVGGRVEWDYTISDLLPGNGNLHDVFLLFNTGVRY